MADHVTLAPPRAEASASTCSSIAEWWRRGSRVLDVGCGDGALLDYLVHFKQVDGRGIELSQAGVNACVARGLSVIQGDADTDLVDYPDDAFDYVILSQTLQATREPRRCWSNCCASASAPSSRSPISATGACAGSWAGSARCRRPRPCPTAGTTRPTSISARSSDFVGLCEELDVEIEKAIAIDDKGKAIRVLSHWLANLVGEQGLFLLRRQD